MSAEHGALRPSEVHPLLLEELAPGTRVVADGDVIYVTEDLEIPHGTGGTVVRAWGVGLSYVRWDTALERVVATSNDSLDIEEINAHGRFAL